MSENEFSLTRIFLCEDRIYDSVLKWKNVGQYSSINYPYSSIMYAVTSKWQEIFLDPGFHTVEMFYEILGTNWQLWAQRRSQKFKIESFVTIVKYYCNVLHLGC